MAYEWKLKLRPYSDDEAKKLLANVVSPETTDWHYNTHHKGYVTALNNIEKGLETADRAAANGNYSIIGELKRRFTWNHAGTLLHDVYWEVLGGDGDPKRGGEIYQRIERDFGSFDKFREQFTEAAVTQFGSGWAWLVLNSGMLKVMKTANADLPLKHGLPALLTVDVWEHAYYIDYRNARPKYVETFLANLVNWDFVAANYAAAK